MSFQKFGLSSWSLKLETWNSATTRSQIFFSLQKKKKSCPKFNRVFKPSLVNAVNGKENIQVEEKIRRLDCRSPFSPSAMMFYILELKLSRNKWQKKKKEGLKKVKAYSSSLKKTRAAKPTPIFPAPRRWIKYANFFFESGRPEVAGPDKTHDVRIASWRIFLTAAKQNSLFFFDDPAFGTGGGFVNRHEVEPIGPHVFVPGAGHRTKGDPKEDLRPKGIKAGNPPHSSM